MKGKFFYVFWYVGNDPNERGFYVRAKDKADVWAAIEDRYGDEEVDYDVMELKHHYCYKKDWVDVVNGRFVETNDEE